MSDGRHARFRMHPNRVIGHTENSLIHRRHMAADALIAGVNWADGGSPLGSTGMATQADLDRNTLGVRARRIAGAVVAADACDSLSTLDEALRIAQRGHLIGDQQLFRKRIGLIGKSRVTLGAYLDALLARQHFRIDHAGARLALAAGLDMLETGAVTALASHPALFARSKGTRLAMTGETLHFKGRADHPAKCDFVRPWRFRRKTRRERQRVMRRVVYISRFNERRALERNAIQLVNGDQEAETMPLTTYNGLNRQDGFGSIGHGCGVFEVIALTPDFVRQRLTRAFFCDGMVTHWQ